MPSFERCVVLVADDEPTVLQVITWALTRHGYIVISASDGPAALRLCRTREGPIHLALLDVLMPGLSGPELFRCLQETYPKIAVLFMSGYTPESVTALPLQNRELHFMAKPFFPKDLVHRVNTILGNSDVCALLEDEPDTTPA